MVFWCGIIFVLVYARVAEWQTRTFEGRVSNIVWVQVPFLAPNTLKSFIEGLF
mgnify:CR=1 FL=1